MWPDGVSNSSRLTAMTQPATIPASASACAGLLAHTQFTGRATTRMRKARRALATPPSLLPSRAGQPGLPPRAATRPGAGADPLGAGRPGEPAPEDARRPRSCGDAAASPVRRAALVAAPDSNLARRGGIAEQAGAGGMSRKGGGPAAGPGDMRLPPPFPRPSRAVPVPPARRCAPLPPGCFSHHCPYTSLCRNYGYL